MTQLINLVIGALVALDLTAATVVLSPSLTLQARYVGNSRSVVTLNCNTIDVDKPVMKFFKRVPRGGEALLTNWDPSAEQVVILDQTGTSITFRFSQTQEGYFRCQTWEGHYESNEIGLAGSNTMCLIHVCRYCICVVYVRIWHARAQYSLAKQ